MNYTATPSSGIRYDQWRDPSQIRVVMGSSKVRGRWIENWWWGELLTRTLIPGEVVPPGRTVVVLTPDEQ